MKTRFRMPTAYTILFIILAIAAMLTWIVPAGQYDKTADGQPIPGTYALTEQNRQGVGDILTASIKGFYEAADVALFILMVGGFLGVVMETGAITAGIKNIIVKLSGRETLLIPILMVLFGLGGTTFGMWEETIAFFPLLIPVFLAAGFDTMTAVAVILLGAGAGVLCSTVNPFATGIASGFAGVSMGDGILVRLAQLVVFEGAAIWYVMSYAKKVRADPSKSLGSRESISDTDVSDGGRRRLTGRDKVTLALFALTFLIMVYSVIPFSDLGITAIPTLGWWFDELSALFLVSGVVIGLVGGLKEERLVDCFVSGAGELLSVALIIAVSRGITVIMNEGLITDTVLSFGEGILSNLSSKVFGFFVFLLYLLLSVFIPSTSGLAALSIPIMAPLGDFANVARSVIITAFQSASGIVNLITPTGAVVMGALTLGRIPYDRWIKFSWKYVVGALVVSATLIWVIS